MLGKKQLLKSNHELEVIVIDVTETAIERPKKTEKILEWQEKETYFKISNNC